MRWLKLLIIVGLLVSLFSFAALATSGIDVTPVNNKITPDEVAKFELKVTNFEQKTQRYTIYSLQSGMGWTVDPFPLRDKIIELAPGDSHVVTMHVRPLEQFPPGIYTVSVSIESDLGEQYQRVLKMYMHSEKQAEYSPSIVATIDMDDKISPKTPVSVKVFLENRNPLNITDMQINLQSDIPEFTKRVAVDLPPLEKKTVEFTVVPNEFQQPKTYTLFFVFERQGQTIKVIQKDIEIMTLLPPFSTEISEDKYFLKTYASVIVKNDGNTRNTQQVRVPASIWKTLFTSSEDSMVVVEDDQRYLAWEITLGSNEAATLGYVTNYRLLLYLLLGLIVLGLFYWSVRSPIHVRKKAVAKKGTEGTLSEVKVTLELRNISKKLLKNIEITDMVPGIANVERSLELGTLKPQEIRQLKKGTKIIWKLAELDVKEHRLITYKIKAKLNIVGTLSFPRATITYKKRKKHGKVYSNVFRLSA